MALCLAPWNQSLRKPDKVAPSFPFEQSAAVSTQLQHTDRPISLNHAPFLTLQIIRTSRFSAFWSLPTFVSDKLSNPIQSSERQRQFAFTLLYSKSSLVKPKQGMNHMLYHRTLRYAFFSEKHNVHHRQC
ncbi:hypothetical protein O181_063319 [Austropuccinia psidii MF-1]|uniref:Uncharacterized protein n=1 Tax=Austropuccinia psidii MF-1 TaxID=1389203 RepID=A0A9Q3ELX9_9BASI|nr:hypothetical protein [Austropuccinia psidii MF-1]